MQQSGGLACGGCVCDQPRDGSSKPHQQQGALRLPATRPACKKDMRGTAAAYLPAGYTTHNVGMHNPRLWRTSPGAVVGRLSIQNSGAKPPGCTTSNSSAGQNWRV